VTRYGAWKPLASNWSSQTSLVSPELVVVHTMVGSLAGTDDYFRQNGYGGVESHFGVGHNGEVWQWQDTNRIAEANYRGNHRIVSIETADRGTGFPAWTGSNVPPWTGAQVDALAKLIAFLCNTHRIPCEPVPDSKPGRRGVGYHRLGIDPWRVPDGEVWSTARGKVCPGDRRIAQLLDVIDAARLLLGKPVDQAPSSGAYCRYEERSERVMKLQQFMTRVFPTYNDYQPTGFYGTATRTGVATFQLRTGITGPDANGEVVGPRTLAKLKEHGFQS
jgi:hypothetical protein